MIYLYWYLVIGVVVLAGVIIFHLLSKSRTKDFLQSNDLRKNQWWWRPLLIVIVPILAMMLIVAVWPLAFYWQIEEIFRAHRIRKEEHRYEFKVTKNDLQSKLCVEDIEQSEMVLDPMHAVPKVPFGHLNQAWEAYKLNLIHGDQVWSFRILWKPRWNPTEVREGYVILRDGKIGKYFMKRCAVVE